MDDEVLTYECDNDECTMKGQLLVVPRGVEANCPSCGWFLMARERYGE